MLHSDRMVVVLGLQMLAWPTVYTNLLPSHTNTDHSASSNVTVVHPPWDFIAEHQGYVCLDASTDHAPQMENNTRWSFWALPAGPPPMGGWPVYVEMMAEILSPGDWRHPEHDPPECGNGWVPPSDGWMRPKYNVFDPPAAAMASCFGANGKWLTSFSNCSYFQKAGQLWVSRLHQYLLANGIAILVVNPYAGDTWEWDDPDMAIGGGLDQPYFTLLFGEINAGRYGGLGVGVFNTSQAIFSGFSDGAQMTSWLIELDARKALPKGVHVAAGVFLAGGSHRCYMSPPQTKTNCGACTNAGSCGGGSGSRGCSLTAVPLCCDYCCPANYTEDYYASHPQEYDTHPPCFLAQSADSDFNADLCATKVYYDTLRSNNVTTQLVLLDKADGRCSCVGALNSTTSVGRSSPIAAECVLQPPEPPGDRGNCVDHVCGFAAMVVPLIEFLVNVLDYH
eukprot:m.267663 g.267663  ORF g.267663 m.267663 type:complete len:450 (-) comp74262_c0_seq1:202-1551(-)